MYSGGDLAPLDFSRRLFGGSSWSGVEDCSFLLRLLPPASPLVSRGLGEDGRTEDGAYLLSSTLVEGAPQCWVVGNSVVYLSKVYSSVVYFSREK